MPLSHNYLMTNSCHDIHPAIHVQTRATVVLPVSWKEKPPGKRRQHLTWPSHSRWILGAMLTSIHWEIPDRKSLKNPSVSFRGEIVIKSSVHHWGSPKFYGYFHLPFDNQTWRAGFPIASHGAVLTLEAKSINIPFFLSHGYSMIIRIKPYKTIY